MISIMRVDFNAGFSSLAERRGRGAVCGRGSNGRARVILLLLFATVHRTLGDNGDKLRLIHSLQSERYYQSDFHASLAAIYE